MSSLQRRGVQRAVKRLGELGGELPADLAEAINRDLSCTSWAGREWERLHPDEEPPPMAYGCCMGVAATGDLGQCTCWVPVYDLDQAEVQPGLPGVRAEKCHDCAYRPNSPERAEDFTREQLLGLGPDEPFFCHQGMRRPREWRHPDGRTVPGSTADYQPPIMAGVAYRADGTPGELCAGWAFVAAAAVRRKAEA